MSSRTMTGPAGVRSLAGPSPAQSGGDRNGGQVAGERRAVGYGRLSPGERKDAGAEDGRALVGVGLIDQRAKVEAWCLSHSCELVGFLDDVDKSGKTLRRQGLQRALEVLDAGEADVLVAAKLDRLARSVIAVGQLVERSLAGGWSLVVLDFDMDTSTAAGRLVANVMAAVGQWEREAIGERTRDALAVKRGQGVLLGRRSTLPPAVVARIRRDRVAGLTMPEIAAALNAEGVPTGQGGQVWRKQSVAAVLASRGG